MSLPLSFFLHLLPLGSSLAAAISLTAVYGLLSTTAYSLFGVLRYPPYLSAALGAGGKFLGFLLRSIFLANSDLNVYAASTVFIAAGMSACTSAQAGVLSDWFQNATAAQSLRFHRDHPRALPALCRLMSIPVILFGPGIGVPAAVLMYGTRKPDSVRHALKLRKWSAWGTLACLAVLTVLALLAFTLAVFQRRRASSNSDSKASVLPVLSVLASVLLIETSGAARVRNVYDSSISLNDSLYYPLIVLPELVQQLMTTWPTLMLRAGKADTYAGWHSVAWGWVQRAFPGAAAADAAAAAEAGTVAQGKPARPSEAADDGASIDSGASSDSGKASARSSKYSAVCCLPSA